MSMVSYKAITKYIENKIYLAISLMYLVIDIRKIETMFLSIPYIAIWFSHISGEGFTLMFLVIYE